MIENLVATFEELSINPGIDAYTIIFNAEANLSCCFASIAELDANGIPQVASANFIVMNTGIWPTGVENEWKVTVRIQSNWRGPLRGRVSLLCI